MAQTVSAGYAKSLLDYVATRGVDSGDILRKLALDATLFDDPDRRLPFEAYKSMMAVAKQATGDPALALHYGAANDFNEFSVVGLICYSAPTMGAAFQQLARYSRLVAEMDIAHGEERFGLVPDDRGLWMIDTHLAPEMFIELTESTWARFIAETRRHFPDAAFAREVHVPYPAPPHAAVYEEVYGAPVTFESDRNAMLIDPSWLSIELPTPYPNAFAFRTLINHADQLMERLKADDRLVSRVEEVLLPALHRDEAGMDMAASALGMSRQTLYRRLKEEGTSFEAILDTLRYRMALRYIEGGHASMNEIAYLLGFSDPSVFSRAFKRWTGKSPSAWKAEGA